MVATIIFVRKMDVEFEVLGQYKFLEGKEFRH